MASQFFLQQHLWFILVNNILILATWTKWFVSNNDMQITPPSTFWHLNSWWIIDGLGGEATINLTHV